MFVVDTILLLYAVNPDASVLMREHGITEIRTADADFHQFRFLTVVNPLDSETA